MSSGNVSADVGGFSPASGQSSQFNQIGGFPSSSAQGARFNQIGGGGGAGFASSSVPFNQISSAGASFTSASAQPARYNQIGGINGFTSSSAQAVPFNQIGGFTYSAQGAGALPNLATSIFQQHNAFGQRLGIQAQGFDPRSNATSTGQQQLGLQAQSFNPDSKMVAEQQGRSISSDSPSTSTQESPTPSQSSFPQTSIFKSSQQRVNLWQYIMVDAKDVKRGKLLGRGAYAEVYEGRALGGIECAIKLYRSTALEKQRKEAMREIRLGASLDHPCTLRILGWVRLPLQTITELCCGDLKVFYKDEIEGFLYSESQALLLPKVCGSRALFSDLTHLLPLRANPRDQRLTHPYLPPPQPHRKAPPASSTSTP